MINSYKRLIEEGLISAIFRAGSKVAGTIRNARETMQAADKVGRRHRPGAAAQGSSRGSSTNNDSPGTVSNQARKVRQEDK